MSAISNLFGYLLNWLYMLLNNFGFSIIIFSIILRIILIPITIKQQKTMKKSAKMQEKVSEIQNKYKNNPEKLNQETIDLYKKEKMSPFSGCLSSILQIVIILAVFYLVSKPLTYMKKVDSNTINNYISQIKQENGTISSYSEIEVINKKGSQDPNIYINMDFLGIDLSKVPNQNIKDPKVYIIPILYVITSFISIRITNKIQPVKKKEELIEEGKSTENNSQEEYLDSMQQMTKSMNYMMPIMSIFIAFIAPLGLALYWLVSNLLMILERIIIDKVSKASEEE
jgi:YidC/Oxa1 family membrane protein insertase